MRVTNRMMLSNFLNNLNTNLKIMQKGQNQLSTGQRYNRPSDDPISVARIMDMNTAISEKQQYKKNMDDAVSWLESTDDALNQVGNILQRASELAVQGAKSYYNETDRESIAEEVDQLYQSLIDEVGNTALGDKYIFAGNNINQSPFSEVATGVVYSGDQGVFEWEIESGVKKAININGHYAFNLGHDFDSTIDDNGVFEALKLLSNELKKPDCDVEKISGDIIGNINQQLNYVLNVRAEVGARSNAISNSIERNSSEELNMTSLLSKMADIDIAESVMYYKTQEVVYQAALNSGAMIMQPTLLNYLS